MGRTTANLYESRESGCSLQNKQSANYSRVSSPWPPPPHPLSILPIHQQLATISSASYWTRIRRVTLTGMLLFLDGKGDGGVLREACSSSVCVSAPFVASARVAARDSGHTPRANPFRGPQVPPTNFMPLALRAVLFAANILIASTAFCRRPVESQVGRSLLQRLAKTKPMISAFASNFMPFIQAMMMV